MNGPPAFHEEWVSPHVDPLAPTHQDFDFQEIDRRLGLVELRPTPPHPDSPLASMSEDELVTLGSAIKKIFHWLISDYVENARVDLIGWRLVASAWVLDPGIFGGLSQTKLAAVFGGHKMSLSRHASEFSRLFGVRGRGQAHGWNFGNRTKIESENRTPHVAQGLADDCKSFLKLESKRTGQKKIDILNAALRRAMASSASSQVNIRRPHVPSLRARVHRNYKIECDVDKFLREESARLNTSQAAVLEAAVLELKKRQFDASSSTERGTCKPERAFSSAASPVEPRGAVAQGLLSPVNADVAGSPACSHLS